LGFKQFPFHHSNFQGPSGWLFCFGYIEWRNVRLLLSRWKLYLSDENTHAALLVAFSAAPFVCLTADCLSYLNLSWGFFRVAFGFWKTVLRIFFFVLPVLNFPPQMNAMRFFIPPLWRPLSFCDCFTL